MFRHKITIKQPTIVIDEYKQQSERFVDFGIYFAMKKTQKSNEVIGEGLEKAEIVDRFIVKYSKRLNTLIETEGTGFKLFHNNAEYDVISAINDNGMNEHITIIGKVVTK